ncbi:4Fe-4S dicluster domain-containing protein [Thermodesulfitimonas autotrophica]|uniref:4Fe-4S dicluster domain-containing protein n=1 Tax=Thermodesulfitimonas autotrophica TaxID=1894989 RepID=UPI002FE12996
MTVKVNPNLARTLKKFGATTATQCYHCGNCTVVCPLSTDENQFPRRFMRFAQLGMEDKLKNAVEPWLCYYCGDCSRLCPRQANPGEVMMSMRRYLTSLYDWTGLSLKVYTSRAFEFLMVAGLFAATLILVFLLQGQPSTEHADLSSFLPRSLIIGGGMLFGAAIAFMVALNILRMHKFIMSPGEYGQYVKIPASVYIKELGTFLYHFVTQNRFSLCTNRSRYIKHFLLVLGFLVFAFYAGFMVLVEVIRDGLKVAFVTGSPHPLFPALHPVRLLEYAATTAVLYVVIESFLGRLAKKEPLHQQSHSTDWTFLLLVGGTVLTGMLTHIFRNLDVPTATYWAFALHLAFIVPLFVVGALFAKWAHAVYRPLALYFIKVKQSAQQMQQDEFMSL